MPQIGISSVTLQYIYQYYQLKKNICTDSVFVDLREICEKEECFMVRI